MTEIDLPQYVKLFGNVDFREGDSARSVYSPAAYLVDLLQLKDDKKAGIEIDPTTSLEQRRKDIISSLLLNKENTFDLLPYLDIVNEVLESKIEASTQEDAYDVLKNAHFHLDLPFNLQHERIQLYLEALGIAPEQLHKAFARKVNYDFIASEFLGLSNESVNIITQSTRGEALAACYGQHLPLPGWIPVSLFLETTGLSRAELKELLFAALDEKEILDQRQSDLFYNQGLDGFATYNDSEREIIWSSGNYYEEGGAIPEAWYDRIHRLIRLAKKTGLSITDAEHVVRNCCDYQLNKESLKIIASIKYIAHNFDIPIDEASALLGPLTYLGRGNSERPDDIFNRSFNGPRSEFEASYIQAPLYSIPTYFESYTRLSFQDDVLALDNKPYRQRIARSLGVSEQQLQAIIQGFRLRTNLDIEDQNQHNQLWTSSAEEASLLATMLRFTRLTRLLELSADELFIMFDILERDPSIHSEAEAEIFIDFESLEWNCYLILQHGKTNELLWLVQRLNQLAHWSRENNLAVEDLLKITLGRNHEIVNPEPKSDSSKVTSKDEKELSATLQFFNNLYQRMKSSLLNPESYAAETQDPRLSTKIYEAVRHQKNILVNAEDVRLVHKNDSAMKQVAYKVITQLDEVRATDFLGLNLREKYAEKIYSNLRLMGVLDSDGMLDSKLMSESETDFNLETDFSEFKLPLFNLIADIIQNEDDASVFPSDLKALSLNEAELEELYDNLIFNAYIDSQGEILQPSIFESMDNLSLFEIQSDISDYAPIIYQLLMKKLRVFAATKITISGDLFAELPLTEAETINLVQNLKFNDYINEKNQLNDNQQLLEVNADLLLLDIRFYPQRQAILDTLQAQIGKIKRDILKITIHDMIDVSDQIVADLTYRIIAGQFLEKGQISKSNREYFLAQEQDENFDILWSFDPNDNRMVFERLQSILRTSDEYKLNASLLEPFDFSLEEVEELQNILAEMKFLNDKYIPQFDKIIYFLTVENALQFTIPGFEDFNKDVFFILNSLARKLDSAISEFSALHISLCDRQQQLCYQALGDALGLSRQAIETITQRVFSITENMTDEWLLPILASVNEIDRIESLPKPSRFNIGYRRVNQFAKLVQTLSLGAEEIDVAFADQELVDKFPIPIELPVITDKTGENYQLNTIDALLESADGQIYLFKSARNTIANDYARVWIYSSTDAKALSSESDKLADLLSHQSQKPLHINKVNAAFVDALGNNVIIADGIYYFKNPNDETAVWQVKDRQWSHVDNDFLKLQSVDASFTDSAGRSFLFSNDQFVRYSQISASADANELLTIDNGYPKNIVESWSDETDNTQLAEPFSTAIDAAFHGADNNTYFFKDDMFIVSNNPKKQQKIIDTWGKVENSLASSATVDSVYADDGRYMILSGKQIVSYRDSLENQGIFIEEGFPQTLENYFGAGLPGEFHDGVDAAFKGLDDRIHLFRNEKSISLQLIDARPHGQVFATEERWGIVENHLANTGLVDAALAGLDGRVYLFSGHQYYRYSRSDYAEVDTGFPRHIDKDWGGLNSIHAAFVMDGKTYLFGTGQTNDSDNSESLQKVYVRYSSNDFSKPDEGFPKLQNETDDFWWNLPETIKSQHLFSGVDAVFNAPDGRTYLFSKNVFIYFDQAQRWWSEPQAISQFWKDLPFSSINAAFSGKDGKTYFFSGDEYVRFSSSDYCQLDNGYPRPSKKLWGYIRNNIQEQGTVDAALIVQSREEIEQDDGSTETTKTMHTYLFSGDQFFRYAGNNYSVVESGYPKTMEWLAQEPRFKNVDPANLKDLQAAVADIGNVYLFSKNEILVISEEIQATYDRDLNKTPIANQIRCLFQDQGAFYALKATEWHQVNNPEATVTRSVVEEPPLFAGVAEQYKQNISAVLNGSDGNTYLFNNNHYFNLDLNRAFPIAAQWGRVRNNIRDLNRINTGLVARDGRTYIFSGDQFVVYDTEQYLGQSVFIKPDEKTGVRSIAEFWAGLENVAYAYVQNNQTFLFEKADYAGNFRYVRYSSSDYQQPDIGFPKTANHNFWQIPEHLQIKGWNLFDAIVAEEDDTLLFVKGKEFLQFNSNSGDWSAPQLLNKLWSGLHLHDQVFNKLEAAFQGADDTMYFFGDGCYISHNNGQASAETEVNKHWGIVANPLQAKVDAAFVHNGTTYLFSGSSYVRYSGHNYAVVDEGYPKSITSDLRLESGFEHLPDAFEVHASVLDVNSDSVIIQAATSNQGNIYLYMGTCCYVSRRALTRTYPISILGQQRNQFANDGQIDAAFTSAAGKTYLFAKDQFIRYSKANYKWVDEGYPKRIVTSLANELNLKNLPWQFNSGIDAALQDAHGTTYLFKDGNYFSSRVGSTLGSIQQDWGKSKNNFEATNTIDLIDGALLDSSGQLYIFRGDQYLRYDDTTQPMAQPGYPRNIDSLFECPATFASGIDAAFNFAGDSYLVKGGSCIRYSGDHYSCHSKFFPARFSDRWGGWVDYQLSDLQKITRFKQLNEDFVGEIRLVDILSNTGNDITKPYEALSDIFAWDKDEVKWLKRNHAFLADNMLGESQFNIELINRMFVVFASTQKLGSDVKTVYTTLWQKLYSQSANLNDAANALYGLLASGELTGAEWQASIDGLHNQLNELKRDALVSYITTTDQYSDAKDLYENLLIDVSMEGCATTSRVKEAISAIQLYFHRYLVNLENLNQDPSTKQDIKQWWKWMKNYRVWEANRKVFLYPENYIRPELRDTKTPEFETLESTLLQGEINKANVDATFSAYLDRFADIGNLKMAGANVYNDGDERVLLLFGHSRTGALQYYYRTARFPNNDEANTAIWAPWQKVELMIAASRVFPVQFMGRLMLFWIEINEIEDSQGKITQQDGNSYADVTGSNQKLKYYASVKYSFKNFSEQWCTPQTLKDRIELEYKIDAAFTDGDDIVIFSGDYCLKTSDAKPYGDVKRIAEAYPDIPREFHTGISAATIYKNKKYFFKGNKCYVEDMRTANKSRIVSISNLIKYEKNQNLIILNAGPFGWANFSTIAFDASISASEFDAAFTINDTLCLVDNSGSYYFYKEKSSKTGTHLVPVQTIDSVTQGFFNFTIFANKQNSFDPADAVFQKGNQYFVIRGGQYEVYSVVGKELQPIDGYPKPIKGNLGINMDKLFDKLHVELEQQTNKLHITYTTPNDSVLLYGTLNTDFSFDTDRNQYNNVFQRLRQAHSLLAQNNGSLPDTSGDATLGSDLHTAWEDAGIHNQTAIELRNAPVATNLFESVVQNASALTDSNKAANRKAFSNSVSAYREFVQNANNRLPSSIEPLLSYVDQLETLISAPGKRKDDDSGDTKVLNKKKLETLEKTINDAKKELNRIVIVLQQSFNKLMDDVQALLTRIERLQENLTDTGIYTLTTSLKLHHSIAVNLQNLKNQIVNLDLASSQTSESGLFTSVDTLVSNIFKTEQSLNTSMTESLTRLSAASRTTDLEGIADHLTSSASELDKVLGHFSSMTSLRTSADQPHSDLINSLVVNIYNQKEILAGRNDIFPSQFQIENRTNFSFSEPNWYVFEEQMGSFLCRPLAPGKSSNYEIIRLNTSNTPTFTQNLFAGGIDALLSRETQALDEWPKFGASHIRFNRTYFGDNIPQSDHLDFKGANAEYYWELFFHAPFLIAATLNENQKFEEAKQWYEYIFDPTDANQFWKFLPFNGMDDASQVAQIEKYLNDPFDPHAIAALRLSAYKKTIIMAYVDNLLDWGDMLFQQYTHESINEARMLYILAYDLLGERPQNLGQRLLSDDRTYVELLAENSSDNKAIANNRLRNTALSKLTQGDSDYDFLVYPPQTPNASVLDPYFYVPPNTQLTELWTRVEDRLYKIRHCLNLKGISQPLPLFQPPIDPMALVQAVSSGAGLDAGLAGLSAAIPHYRFSFSVRKAQELVSKLGQFGGELLSTLEKRDAEELSQMQNQQEQTILSLTRNIRKAQLEESKHHLASLKESKNAAEQQLDHYSQLLASGLSAGEIVQIALMTAGSTLMTVAAIGKLAAAIPESTGEAHVGPFIAGVTTGGKTVADVLGTVSESSETGGDALSTMAEIAGILAQHHRSTQDWELQKKMASSEIVQIEQQIEGAMQQVEIAKREIEILEKEIEHKDSIKLFMHNKFTNSQLYQWIAGNLSTLYYQTYQMAYDLAKKAEKAFQFERGLPESEVNFINGIYWDSQKKGLLAGERLGLSLDQMEKSYYDNDARRFEITKTISLLQLDPLAFLTLKNKGQCDFHFSEELFAYDFPSHYCRQIKTIALKIDAGDGVSVNATLTQLRNKIVMKPDAKAVKYLINPKDEQPTSIRNDWRASQQIAVSKIDDYTQNNNGMFEANMNDERYLAFEGTGAVSSWRLQLGGKRGSYNINELTDVSIELKYTALQGGSAFGDAVKGLLKPYSTSIYFDVAETFADAYEEFVNGNADELVINLYREMFPNLSGNKITGIYPRFVTDDGAGLTMVMNNDSALTLRSDKLLLTDSLSLSSQGETWRLKPKGDAASLLGIGLVLMYKANAS